VKIHGLGKILQRDCITRGLLRANDEDLIIISDADEIPNPEKIIHFNPKKKYGVFEKTILL
jgi:hypothetical protein